MAKAEDVENLVKKCIPPKPIKLKIESETINDGNTFSPFVVEVMTNRKKSYPSAASSSKQEVDPKIVKTTGEVDINQLTETLKRNVSIIR